MTSETLTEQLPAWEAILNRWGLPIVILIVVAYAVYRATRWLGPRADRLIESHLHLVDTLETKLVATEANTSQAVKRLEQIEATVEEIDSKIDRLKGA